MQKKAFSLIELMVVVAIIAVLAAIAVPIYTNYQRTTNISAILNTMQSIQEQSIIYANLHGYFPSAAQLGVSTATFNSPYISSISMPGDSCGKSAYVNVVLNGTAMGFPSNMTNIGMSIDFYHDANHIVHSTCDYWELNGGSYLNPDSSFPASCISQYNSSGPAPTWNAWTSASSANATCM